MGLVGRYLSGLCVATLGLCAAGWLALAPLAFGYQGPGLRKAALTDRATGAGLALVSLVTLVSWVVAWRRKLRADGLPARTSRWQAPNCSWSAAVRRRHGEQDRASWPGGHLRGRGLAGRSAVRAAVPAGGHAMDGRGPAGRHRRRGAGRGRFRGVLRGARGPGQ